MPIEMHRKLRALVKRTGKTTILFMLLCLVFIVSELLNQKYDTPNSLSYHSEAISKRINSSLRDPLKPVVYLASVICDGRIKEGMVMLKTAMFFSRDTNLYLIIFTDDKLRERLENKLKALIEKANKLKIHVDYEIHLEYVHPTDGEYWHKLFRPCSTQRVFFPLTLPHIDHVMYVDTDVMFLSSITDLWDEFDKMKPSQLAAVAPEHELPGDGWYNRRSRIPYYGPRGLNTGIMLMNLTAMRAFDFLNKVISINSEYSELFDLADQDMLNVLFNNNPSTLHEVGCEFNYRHQHCKCDYPLTGDCGCKNAEKNGISIFHGNRRRFSKQPFIGNIHNTFRQIDLLESPKKVLSTVMSDYNNLNSSLDCTNISVALFTKFQKYAQRF